MPEEPKKPRGMPPIPRDRDQRETTSPPPGSALDKLRQEAEARRNQYARAGTPVEGVDYRTVHEQIADRAKRAADGVAELRTEFGDRITALEGTVQNIDGKVDVLVAALPAALQAQTLTVATKLEVAKAETVTRLEVDKAERTDVIDARKFRRSLVLKIVGAVMSGSVITALIALVAQKC